MKTNNTKLNVAVIGAGPSGLVTIKELLAAGHQVSCFEMSQSIGGVFQFRKSAGGVYESCKLTSSATATTYSDFNLPKGTPYFLSHQDYIEYLHSYSAEFNLKPHIRLNSKVTMIQRQATGEWAVQTECQESKTKAIDQFDAIAVCTGVHEKPLIPSFEGENEFKGSILHSSLYKNPDAFKGKKIVIIGAGESGADIIKEVADTAETCTLSLRRGVQVLPRLIRGFPNDFYTTRLFHSLPKWMVRVSNPKKEVTRNRIIAGILLFPFLVPLFLFFQLRELMLRIIRQFKDESENKHEAEVAKIIHQLSIDSGGGIGEQFLTKSEKFVHALVDGSCQLKPGIERINESQVFFKDGTSVDADIILCCTGYQNEFEFLKLDLKDSRQLYLNCIHPEIGKKLCFIGVVRPGAGSIPPIAEMQARWFAQLSSNELDLPSKAEMVKTINEDRVNHKKTFNLVSERLHYLVDYTSYMDQLAGIVGCKPRLRDLILHPKALYKMYCGNFSSSQYRLSGAAKKPKIALKELKNMEIAFPFFTNLIMFIVFFFCKLLNTLGLSIFKPHLSLSSK